MITSEKVPIVIYENPDARPKAYFADAIETMAENEKEAIVRMLKGDWPDRKSLIECEPDCEDFMSSNENPEVAIVSDEGHALTLQTSSVQPQWLVVNINRLPGWTVTIDGKQAQSVFANGTFFGIQVPGGDHRIEVRFSMTEIIRYWFNAHR